MPLTRGRSVRFDGLLHRDSFETGSFGNRSRLFSGLGPPRRVGGILGARAPVAQWIERWVPDPKVAGSSPVGRATSTLLGSASAKQPGTDDRLAGGFCVIAHSSGRDGRTFTSATRPSAMMRPSR